MSEKPNNDSTNESSINKEIHRQEYKRSLLDSLFFSTTAIAIIGAIFFISMFLSGWYIFTIKDREADLIKAKEWVAGHQTIINSAKENQNKLNDLILEVNDAVSEKRILLIDIEDRKSELISVENDYNRLTKELELKREELNVIRDYISKDEVIKSSLTKEIPNLEMEWSKLNAKIIDLNSRVNKKENELAQKEKDYAGLEGKYEKLQGQLSEQTKNLKSINNVNSDFSIIQKRLEDAADKIESNEQITSTSIKNQIDEMKKHNKNLNEQANELIAINSKVKSAEIKLSELNNNINNDVTDLNKSIDEIESTSESLDAFSEDFQKSGVQFNKATQSIRSVSEDFSEDIKDISKELIDLTEKYKQTSKILNQLNNFIDESEKGVTRLNRQTELFKEQIDEKSIDELKSYINDISDELTELNKQIKLLKEKAAIKLKG